MSDGMYREYKPELEGECARVDIGEAAIEVHVNRDTYVKNGYQPPFDELPTKEEYLKDK